MRFILLDKIHEMDPGKQIRASKTLPAHEELFRDHFPGFPVIPGVLLTEMMAQAAGKCLDAQGTRPGRAMLGTINGARFREWVRPDQEIMLHATITQDRATYATADCFAEVGGRKVCSARLLFVFAPHEQFAPGYEDEVLNAYWKANPALQPKQTR
jgi:3-hydroxyacyl-[acyl-carrier-protein] dehydratase